jgi:hypothetical protein
MRFNFIDVLQLGQEFLYAACSEVLSMFMKRLLATSLLALILVQQGQASCDNLYIKERQEYRADKKSPEGRKWGIFWGLAAAIVIGGTAAEGKEYIPMGAAAPGLALAFAFSSGQHAQVMKNPYSDALLLIEQAKAGEGRQLESFIKKALREAGKRGARDLDRDDVIKAFMDCNTEEKFCPAPYEHPKIKDIREVVVEELLAGKRAEEVPGEQIEDR